MNIDNPFDKKLEAQRGMPEAIRAAAISVTDTLDVCWAAARAVFEDKATPDHALAICQMLFAEVARNAGKE